MKGLPSEAMGRLRLALAALASAHAMMDMTPSYAGTAPCTAAPDAMLEDVRGLSGPRRVCEPSSACSVHLVGFYYAD